ncbi:MAG: aldehyde dehydrogenase family protein [Myxococcota bacterium]
MPLPGHLNPATLDPLSNVEWTPTSAMDEALDLAREAQKVWGEVPFEDRCARVVAIAKRILAHREEALALLQEETGRDPAESLLGEVAFVLSYANGAVGVAKRALATERVRLSPVDFPGKRAVIEAVPRGVIAIIEPWNYPLLQFYKPLFPALLSGNAVIMKPSEHTPRTGAWLAEQCAAELPPGVVQVVQGDGVVGGALVAADVDAVVFCGSVDTGRRIAAKCAERLIPCSVELGGKDAAIVLEDCDLQRTVAGVLQWSMHNAGQDCSSIERVYVVEAIADQFVDQLAATAKRLQVVPHGRDLGPLQNEAQLKVVTAHVADALAKGAKLRAGGEATGDGLGFAPTVLDACTDDMLVITDETFGPVVAVVRVPDEASAIAKANASRYGLCGSVWTKNLARGERIARQLDVGIALVNNHSFPGSVPQIPWTGTKWTGTGTAASIHAYPTFVRRRTIVIDSSSRPDVFWKPVDGSLMELGDAVSAFALGAWTQVFRLISLVSKRVTSIRSFVGPKR